MATILKLEGKKGITYKAIIRIKGYKTKCKSFSSLTLAKQWAKKIESQMEHGEYQEIAEEISPDSPRKKIKTMKDLILYFKEYVAPIRYRSPEKYNCMFDWWIDFLGDIYIIKLKSSKISEGKEKLLTEKIIKGKKEVTRGANTVNKYLMCLSAVLTFAVKELEIIEVNPCSKVSTVTKPAGRKRFLSEEELTKLFKACEEHSQMVYVFTLITFSTGARYSEVLHLQVENVDFKNNLIYYLDTKNKESRGVPADNSVMQIIKNYLVENNIESGYIFVNKKKKIAYMRGYLQAIIKKSGIDNFHIHDLRHTTASYIAMNGGSLLDIAEILGHKSLVMARRYSHLTQKHTAKVLSKVTDKLFS